MGILKLKDHKKLTIKWEAYLGMSENKMHMGLQTGDSEAASHGVSDEMVWEGVLGSSGFYGVGSTDVWGELQSSVAGLVGMEVLCSYRDCQDGELE